MLEAKVERRNGNGERVRFYVDVLPVNLETVRLHTILERYCEGSIAVVGSTRNDDTVIDSSRIIVDSERIDVVAYVVKLDINVFREACDII
jgi:hypothetical protein